MRACLPCCFATCWRRRSLLKKVCSIGVVCIHVFITLAAENTACKVREGGGG